MHTRIPELDGLRGIAISSVLLYHFWPKSHGLYPVFRTGWVGVELFFVLSGFLITRILLEGAGKPNQLRRFYWRRALRIFPLYFAVLAAIVGLAVWLGGSSYLDEMRREWGSPAWFAVFAGNLPTAWQEAWPPAGSFVPLWSLQIEEQFYLLYPVVVTLWPRRLRHVLWAAVAVSLVARYALWWWWPDNAHAPYVLTICRMDSLALGGLLALARRDANQPLKGWWLAAGASVLAATALLAGNAWQSNFVHTAGITAVALWFTACLGWVLQHAGSGETAWLRWRPLAYLGTISYGVYLLHMPVAYAFTKAGIGETMAALPLVVGMSIAAGAVSWRFYEARIIRWGRSMEAASPRSTHIAQAPVLAAGRLNQL
jgi:peptidoglycan/LPS O-acetylase OafA/YrhL